MGMNVEQLAAARGRSVADVLAACQRSGVLAWSAMTPLDDVEIGKVDAALAGAAPPPAAGGAGWGAPGATPGVGGPPPPPAYGGPPPPAFGAPPPPAYGAPPPPAYGQPGLPGSYPPVQPARAPRGRSGVGRVVGIVVAIGVSVAVRAGFGAFDDEEDRTRDAVNEVVGADAGDDVDDELAAFALEVGDCFDDHSELATDPTESVEARVEEVPCEGPHDAEVYATPEHPDPAGTAYPGEPAIVSFADEACYSQFQAFVGIPYEQSALAFVYTFPVSESWRIVDDRTIACSVVTVDGTPLTGTMAGSLR